MFNGHPCQSEAAGIVVEYFTRKSLSEIGYRFDATELCSFKADCFGVIANQIGVIEKRESEKAKAKMKRR